MISGAEKKKKTSAVEVPVALRSALRPLKREERIESFEAWARDVPIEGGRAGRDKFAYECSLALGNLLSLEEIRFAVDRSKIRLSKTNEEDDLASYEAALLSERTLKTGITEIDRLFEGGIKKAETLSIVAAESAGKTSLLLGMLEKHDGRTLHFNMDMNQMKFTEKRLAALLRVAPREVAHVRTFEPERYAEAAERIRSSTERFRALHGEKTLDEMENEILQFRPEIVSVDYLTAISSAGNDYEKIKEIVSRVRRWRDRWGLTFVLLSQMGRNAKADTKKGNFGSHGLGGGDIERLVDFEIELIVDGDPRRLDTKRFIAAVTKNRNGPDKVFFELDFLVDGLFFSPDAKEVRRIVEEKRLFSGTNVFSSRLQKIRAENVEKNSVVSEVWQ